MASFFPAPGVAQARITGSVGPNPFAVVLHWFSGAAAAWTQPQVQAMAVAINQHWVQLIVPLFASDVVTKDVTTVDLSDATERSGAVGPENNPGGTPGIAPTLAACILVSHHIGTRYRGGHPRSYLPPSNAANTADGDTWQAAFVSTAQTAWNNFISGVNTDLTAAGLVTPQQTIPRYTYSYVADNNKHKFIKERTGYKGQFPVTSSVVRNQIATQRRRLGV
jgi:hypothetical protein